MAKGSGTSTADASSVVSQRNLGVLISGRGSNLQALIDTIATGELDARIAVVISNKADAAGLDRARAAGIETLTISHRDYGVRADFDRAIANAQ